MAAIDLTSNQELKSFAVTQSAGSDTVTTGDYAVKLKNVGVGTINVSDKAAPSSGAAGAGDWSTLFAAPASGIPDSVTLRPKAKYFISCSGASGVAAFERVLAPLNQPH